MSLSPPFGRGNESASSNHAGVELDQNPFLSWPRGERFFEGSLGLFQSLGDVCVGLPSDALDDTKNARAADLLTVMLREAFRRVRERLLGTEVCQRARHFYPRTLALEMDEHAVLHAKLVVIDERHTFVTSANFTEAAQLRNVEVGLLVDDRALAQRVTRQFERLIESGGLKRLAP